MKVNSWSGIAYAAHRMAAYGEKFGVPANWEGIFLSALDDAKRPADFTLNIDKPVQEVGILMSGGLDSVCCYLMAIQSGKKVKAFYYDIGQVYKEKELRAIADMGIPVEVIEDFKPSGEKYKYDWQFVLPMRNMLFISDIAERIHGGEVYFGVVEGEVKSHLGGDKGKEFLEDMQCILGTLPYPVRLVMPLANMTKGQIVEWYVDNGFEDYLHKNISCLEAEDGHCGRCQTCIKKALAFKVNGLDLITNAPVSEQVTTLRKYADRASLGTVGGEYTQKYIDELLYGTKLFLKD